MTNDIDYARVSSHFRRRCRMSDKVTLVCTECLSRNYTTTRNRKNSARRLELRKYCPKCGKVTLHKETK